MFEGISIVVLGLTVLAFIRKDPILHMVNVVAWLFYGFYMYNQTWPAENTYLAQAAMLLAIAMMIVNLIVALNIYLGLRTTPPTHSDLQREYKKKIIGLTRKKEELPPWA